MLFHRMVYHPIVGLIFSLDPSDSDDISLDELEEELEEHKDYDVSHQGPPVDISRTPFYMTTVLHVVRSMYVG